MFTRPFISEGCSTIPDSDSLQVVMKSDYLLNPRVSISFSYGSPLIGISSFELGQASICHSNFVDSPNGSISLSIMCVK